MSKTASCRLCWRLQGISLVQKSLDIWKGEILMAETWVERHGAALGAVLAFGVMFLLFAWGMSM